MDSLTNFLISDRLDAGRRNTIATVRALLKSAGCLRRIRPKILQELSVTYLNRNDANEAPGKNISGAICNFFESE
ncbi:hypothetical protein [Janthinobacterium sp. 17J80-10]|uniref:hypothetical protein n=1 Tax=Janthinobacterium sp. 17J80-10 TaxID=2497863 RepID=UPI0013E8F15F|nr:hypothetical protein [Janthinobacterium sp. 17J80-10]